MHLFYLFNQKSSLNWLYHAVLLAFFEVCEKCFYFVLTVKYFNNSLNMCMKENTWTVLSDEIKQQKLRMRTRQVKLLATAV